MREKLNRQIAKSALGAEEMVLQKSIEELENWIDNCRVNGYQIVGLENNLAQEEMSKKVILDKNIELGERIVLFLGEEVEGIPAEVRPSMDVFLEIPMYGQKESFNVSVAAGIAMWGLKSL